MAQATINHHKKALLDMFGTDKALYEKASLLIETAEDFHEFVNHYMSKSCSRLMAISAFRNRKLEQRKLSLSEFVGSFHRNEKEALERLFLLPVEQEHVAFLKTLLQKGSVKVEDVYELHHKEPDKPMIRLVLAMGLGN